MTPLDFILITTGFIALVIFTVRHIHSRRPTTRHPYNRPVKRL